MSALNLKQQETSEMPTSLGSTGFRLDRQPRRVAMTLPCQFPQQPGLGCRDRGCSGLHRSFSSQTDRVTRSDRSDAVHKLKASDLVSPRAATVSRGTQRG